jgi:hypothetical protein
MKSKRRYQIRVQGKIDQCYLAWFGDVEIVATGENVGGVGDGRAVTTLTGTVADQAALHGLLQKLYTLRLPLLEVRQKEVECLDDPVCDWRRRSLGRPGTARADGRIGSG